jgi:trigger factor
VEVFVRPDVTLGEYKNLTVEVAPKHVVTEEEIDERIKQDQQKGARTVDVTDRTVDYNDTVNLDYAGSVDGVAFAGGTAQGQTLKIGSGQFIPGFEEQMVGMAIGEEKDLNVTFPEQYHSEELAGKAAVFHVKVNSITMTELPELDDDFAQDNGFDSFADYKASVEKELNERAESNYNVTIENALIEAAVANAQMDVPESMIQTQVANILREMEYRMMYQGLRMEDYLKYTGQTREQLAEQYREEGEHRVKIELTLEAIRKAEALEPTEEEVDAQIAKQAERMGQEVEAFKAGLTEEQHAYMVDTAAIQKVCDLLKADAIVNEKADAEEDAE